MIRIVADDKIPFLKGVFEGVAEVDYLPGGEISPDSLAGADALVIRTRTKCDRSLLEGSGVRFIATATIGHDHIDTAYCSKAGIRWTNAPGCNASSVQQYMVSTLLYLAVSRGLSLGDLTLGVVGVGNVGRKVALAAEAMGMRVLRNDPPRARKEGGRGFVTLHELLERSDLVTLHVPLNRKGRDKTYRMVEGEFIRALKPGCILINTSRGEVVNEQELIRGTAQGRLGGLVLDVFEGEPRINQELLDRVTLATPHIAGYSLDGKAGGTIMSVRALSRFFHLGMDHWEPDHIPLPGETALTGDPAAKGRQELLWELYRATYDVTLDDKRLRRQPDRFEALRGDYPPRREPHIYTVGLPAGCRGIASTLESLGFSIKNII